MDAKSSLKWIFSLFFISASCCSAVFAGPTFIYGGNFDLPIHDKQASGSSMTEALIQVPDHLTIYDLDVVYRAIQAESWKLIACAQRPGCLRHLAIANL